MGNLECLKIWHDNSGKGDMASWFLSHIIVKDLHTKEKFYFLCQNWLAVENGDGKVERGLFVAFDKQKTELKYLMERQAKTYLNDKHLWLSVFKKPVQSSFSRLDRVTCVFVFHYVSMALNILYYDSCGGFFPTLMEIDFSLFKLTFEQVIRDFHF